MVPSKNGARQVIKASIAALAPIALTMTLCIIVAMADNCSATAFDTTHTLWPAMPADQLEGRSSESSPVRSGKRGSSFSLLRTLSCGGRT